MSVESGFVVDIRAEWTSFHSFVNDFGVERLESSSFMQDATNLYLVEAHTAEAQRKVLLQHRINLRKTYCSWTCIEPFRNHERKNHQPQNMILPNKLYRQEPNAFFSAVLPDYDFMPLTSSSTLLFIT